MNETGTGRAVSSGFKMLTVDLARCPEPGWCFFWLGAKMWMAWEVVRS
jgi:hypothetical protein